MREPAGLACLLGLILMLSLWSPAGSRQANASSISTGYAPVAGVARTNDGRGYWLVAWDGGVFSFGDAIFSGSMGGRPLNAVMIGIAADPDGTGYWTAGQDGGVFAFGDAPFLGSVGNRFLNRPFYGIAASG